ncbi:MAG: arginase family protein [Bacteroides sp.]
MEYIAMNFSNVYERQDFKDAPDFCYTDVSDITGTDCYCDDDAVLKLKERIKDYSYRGIHYIDSGNYHYMSKLWTDKIDRPFVLVVFDNHPDMQRPLFGDILSCGGWIKEVLDNNKYLEKVIVIGVNNRLLKELDDDVLREADNNRVCFVTRQEIADAMDCSANGCEESEINIFEQKAALVGENKAVYISIDKDVLDESVVKTNWDQGDMRINEIYSYIKEVAQKNEIIGADVCGEPSHEEAVNDDIIIRSNTVNLSVLNILKKFLM